MIDMLEIREWTSVIIFFIGLAGVYTLFDQVFAWSTLFGAVLCFFVAYIIWPSKRKGQRDDGGRIADIFELLIELPFELLSWCFKLLGRLFKGKGDGVDIDFDI